MSESAIPRRRRWLRRLIWLVLVFGVAGLIALWFPTRTRTAVVLPSPNGYDDLVRAGAMIGGTWPNSGDLPRAKVEEVRPFVAANQASLDRLRIGLDRECMVPMKDSQEGLAAHLPDLQSIRQLSRLLVGEGMVFEDENRPVEAARCYRELLELGLAVTPNGMEIDALVGVAIQTLALQRIQQMKTRLPRASMIEWIATIESVRLRRITIDAIEERRSRWVQGAYSPYMRTMMRWQGIDQQTQADSARTMKAAFDKLERSLQFFQVELAIRVFHEDRQSWPRSVAELVPDYLATVPIDPATAQPLEYPANDSGELTDDLSRIARPDGSVTPRP